MKTIITLLIILSGLKLIAQTNSGKNNTPNVEGEVFEGKSKLGGVTIKVYFGDKLLKTTQSDSLGNYKLSFGIDTVYIVELSKENYITKKYEVCTKDITKERLKEPVNTIMAQSEMHKTVEGVDYSVYKKPMVKFFFNKKTDKFEYDTKHFAKAYDNQKKVTEKEKQAIYKAKLKKK